MTAQEVIATIRAEIERRLKKYATDVTMPLEALGKVIFELKGILSFLSTLEESKKPMNRDELEKELDRYLHGEFQQTAGGNFNNYIQVARHFAKWGAEHLKK